MSAKVHTSSVAVVPPAAVWRRIQALRCFADKSFVRWPPHINLLYPFHPDGPKVPELLGEAEDSARGTGGGRQRSGASRSSGGRGRGGACRVGPWQAGSEATAPQASLLAGLPTWDASGGEAGGQLQLHAAADSGGLVEDPFGQLAARAGRALAQVQPFKVRLEQLRVFRHSARSITVWADPVTMGAATTADAGSGVGAGPAVPVGLVAVQALLEAEFPACSDLSADEGRNIRGFVPHLSLGQLQDERELEALQAAWEPVEWLVDSVQLISRKDYLSPFTVRYHVPFGLDLDLDLEGGDGDAAAAPRRSRAGSGVDRAVRRLDVPYVATLANLQPRQRQEEPEQQPADGDVDAWSLVERFAAPCLVLPPRPPQPSATMLLQHSTASAAVADLDKGRGAGISEEALAEAAPDVGRVSGGAEAAESRGFPETRPAPAAAGTGLVADAGGGDGLAAGAEGPSVWWFAYGAALQASAQELGALESQPAVLAGSSYRLAFNRLGARANLVQAGTAATGSGSVLGLLEVHGVLHRLSLERMARLLLVVHEACPTEVACVPYGHEPATAHAGAASTSTAAAPVPASVIALAFVAPPERCLPQEAQPNPGYLQALLDGCGAYGLDSGFRDGLQSILQAAAPVEASASGEGLNVGAGAGSGGEGDSTRQRQGQGRSQRPGREPQRLQNRRTGAKKAVAGLPRGATDW